MKAFISAENSQSDRASVRDVGSSMLAEPISLSPAPLNILFDNAFDLYKQNALPILLAAALVYLPVQLVLHSIDALWLRPILHQLETLGEAQAIPTMVLYLCGLAFVGSPENGVPGLITSVTLAVASAPITHIAAEALQGRSLSAIPAYRQTKHCIPRLLVAQVLQSLVFLGAATLAASLSLFALIGATMAQARSGINGTFEVLFTLFFALCPFVAGCWAIAASYLFYAPIIVLEKGSVGSVPERTRRLVQRPKFSRYVFAAILLPLLSFGFQALLTALFLVGLEALSLAAWAHFLAQFACVTLVGLILQPYLMIAVVVIYFDARFRREGLDIRLLAENAGMPEPTAPLNTNPYLSIPHPATPPPKTPKGRGKR